MVSGYLENDTIRELIGDGVGGVFLKPLNIFSLLERTAELIEETSKSRGDREGILTGNDGTDGRNLDFNFRSFPCKAPISILFAERLHRLRNFKSTLTLIGESGANYRGICKDLIGFYESKAEHFIYFSPDSFDEVSALSLILKAQDESAGRVTCVLLGVELMSSAQKKLATWLARAEGPFESDAFDLRTIFCLSGDLDLLFDDGVIDENLYILMGTAEIRVPALSKCGQDIAIIAQQQIVGFAGVMELSSVPILEQPAVRFLEECSWEGDFMQLRAVVHALLNQSKQGVIDVESIKVAKAAVASATPRQRAALYLSGQKSDYAKAVLTLCRGDIAKAADFFGVEVSQLEGFCQ